MLKVIAGIAVVFLFFYTILMIGEKPLETSVRPEAVFVGPTFALPAVSGSFDASGTIEYTQNSTGQEIPYLVYRLANGEVMTKAIVFGNGSDCETKSGWYPCPLIEDSLQLYFGVGPVRMEGTIVSEHVVVTRMTLV